jgi:putative membrane protein
MNNLKKYLLTSVKGACMGAADVIPGVSGGTIAFIMGIYDEFVGSIARIDAESVKMLAKFKIRDFWKHINGNFLLSLIIGIGVSIVALAGLMQTLLSQFPIQTWGFFFGLIVASSIFILRGIEGWRVKDGIALALGICLGVVVCTLSPTQTPDALWFIFISGAIAICAMILPGISGSFILLILGKYQFIMGAISGLASGEDFGRNLMIIGVFLVGAVVGILGFSKLLHWLLARWNKETLIVLAGFIIGSLVKVWPWSNMPAIVCSQFPAVAALSEAAEEAAEAAAGSGPLAAAAADAAQKAYETAVTSHASMIEPQIFSAVVFAVIGFCLVTGIEVAGKIMSKKNA